MQVFWSLTRTVAAFLLATGFLAGCGAASSHAALSPSLSKTGRTPTIVTVTHSIPVTKTVIITRTVQPSTSARPETPNPNAPTNVTTPVPLTIQGMANASPLSSITVGYNINTDYQWNLFSLTLWVLDNPGGSYTLPYWTVTRSGAYSFIPPMALQNTTDRIIVQLIGSHGQIVTEYGPIFHIR